MRLVHTSDWHLGHTLGRNRRYDEFEAFLDWLAGALDREGADALLVAGDVFDTGSPSNRAQEMYYRFLRRVAAETPCRHVVVVAGNHDSPAFLNAPRELLRALSIHVVGCAGEEIGDEVVLLRAPGGRPELVVCAVPYLRDRDVRGSAAGESAEEKDRNLVEGVRRHYAGVLAAAEAARDAAGGGVSIIATGHLFAAGGKGGGALADDGVRDLYVGSLVSVPADVFPPEFLYVALGHLHAPQIVGGDATRRYSGSPLPLGFGEAGAAKSVVVVDIDAAGGAPRVDARLLPVPVFRPLERIAGEWEAIDARLRAVDAAGVPVWLDVEYTGDELLPDLPARVLESAGGAAGGIVKIGNRRLARLALERNGAEESLDDLDPAAVFERCLDAHGVAETDRGELRAAHAEILHALLSRSAEAE